MQKFQSVCSHASRFRIAAFGCEGVIKLVIRGGIHSTTRDRRTRNGTARCSRRNSGSSLIPSQRSFLIRFGEDDCPAPALIKSSPQNSQICLFFSSTQVFLIARIRRVEQHETLLLYARDHRQTATFAPLNPAANLAAWMREYWERCVTECIKPKLNFSRDVPFSLSDTYFHWGGGEGGLWGYVIPQQLFGFFHTLAERLHATKSSLCMRQLSYPCLLLS